MQSVFIDPTIVKKDGGPGSYNIDNSDDLMRKRNASVVDWSKNHEGRFHKRKTKTPGPGSYEVDRTAKRSSASLSASFAYQGLRSCMDELVYKTKMPFKVKVIEEKGLKDRYPGPGHYNPKRNKNKSFHNGEDGFGSTSFPNEETPEAMPGPGSYLSRN